MNMCMCVHVLFPLHTPCGHLSWDCPSVRLRTPCAPRVVGWVIPAFPVPAEHGKTLNLDGLSPWDLHRQAQVLREQQYTQTPARKASDTCHAHTDTGHVAPRSGQTPHFYSHILQGKTPDSCITGETRMCVGAQWPRAPCSALLFLALVLGAAAQRKCLGHTYPRGSECCQECEPGHGMESRCTKDHGTVCHPCDQGFYNEDMNYEPCKPCTQCNQRSGSKIKQPCTREKDTVCSCQPGTQPQGGFKRGVDCAPCPPGHFSPGNNEACKPWTNCTLAGKRTLRAASNSSDAICEDRTVPATRPWETQSPSAWPSTNQPTTTWARTSQAPATPPTESLRGSMLAAVLGLGLGLGLLAPVAAVLVLLLHSRAWRPLTDAIKPPGGNSFRTPIQEEHSDVHSTLAKI
ncbi:tumor necrosis factor receptor superfamily member 4 isoform X1 [Saccopteryx bilineata]|uniref:tumor necrosis factor receptor superfamily member 4 isoform X1 n=2 Tax=Saccopteryx bilineata TaxID=59482 RepID=UPI00338F24C3